MALNSDPRGSLAAFTQRDVYTVRPDETVREAARRMCRHGVGALVVTDEPDGTPIGMITDRDVVWMIAEGLDPTAAVVGSLLQLPLHTIRVSDGLADAARAMRTYGVRRLPILDEADRLVGLVSLDDLLDVMGRELADLTQAVNTEIARERRLAGGGTPDADELS
jgi:CBS domain-containing protein